MRKRDSHTDTSGEIFNNLSVKDNRVEGLAFFDVKGKILYASPSTIHITGYTNKEMVGNNAFDYVYPGDLQYARDFFANLIQKPYETKTIKSRFIHKGGSIRLFKTTATNMLTDPKMQSVVVHFRDITEIKFREEKIILFQEITQAIAESDDFNSAIAITLQKVCESTGWACGEAWTPSEDETCLEHSNVWYCNIEGMKKFEDESNKYKFLKGVGLPGLVWSTKNPQWMKDITLDDNFPRRHLAIKARLESAMGIPILANDEVIAVMCFLTTEIEKEDERMIMLISTIASQLGTLFQKKQLKNFLKESETTHKNIMESVPVGIAVTTPNEKAVEANPAILKMLGYESKEEILSIPVIKHYHNPYDRERLIKILQEDGVVRNFEVQLIRKDGTLIWCNLNAVTKKNKTGTKFIFSVNDITKDMQREEEIYLLQTMTQAIAESDDFNSALKFALKKICMMTDWGCGEAWVPSADGTYLEHEAWYCNNIEGMKKFEEESDKFRFPKGIGLPGFAWFSKKPEWRTDVTFDDNFPRKQFAIKAGLKSAVAIPILAKNEVVAIMVFLAAGIRRDAERMIKLISIIASQLGTLFQKKQSEGKLQKSETSLLNSQRIAHIGNWEWNMVRNEAFWSDEIYRIFGLTPQIFGATYESFLNSVHPDDREYVKESVNNALYRNIPYSIDHRIVLPDGTVRIVHEQAEVVFDGSGKAIQMNGTIQDITERKQIEDQYRKLSHAVEQSTLSIVITDIKGNIEYANPRLLDITGYTREEAIGKNSKIFSSGKTPPETYKDLWNTILSGKDWHGEFLNKKKDGELFWEHATISPIKNGDGSITNFVAYKEDITTIKKLEEQFRQSQKMEAVGQLTGGIAHDFNNILTGIILSSELLKLKIDKNNPLRANVEQISELSIKASNLIYGLLAFSRKQTINLQNVNLKNVIVSTKKLLSRVIRENIELKINVSGKDLIILANEIQIEQVIINLATNARDSMPNGGLLTIEVSDTEIDDNFIKTHGFGKTGRYALITITDTGIGMDENIQKKIFEPFFTTKEVGKGTGLGLAMVYGLIKQHEGYIDLYSKLGKGTTFKIYLPIKELRDKDLKTKEVVEGIPKRGSETVLVAEDDESTRKIITNILENYGYKVIEAIDGDDALEKFMKNKDRINLVLLDVIMPKRDGNEVYAIIVNIVPNIKILFMSGYIGDVLQVKEIAEKRRDIISKPFTQIDLLKKIRHVLDS